jgi:hypothetical protein
MEDDRKDSEFSSTCIISQCLQYSIKPNGESTIKCLRSSHGSFLRLRSEFPESPHHKCDICLISVKAVRTLLIGLEKSIVERSLPIPTSFPKYIFFTC